MSRVSRLTGLYEFVLKHSPVSKDTLIEKIMRDYMVTYWTAKGYLDAILLGIEGRPKIVNEFGIIKVKDAK